MAIRKRASVICSGTQHCWTYPGPGVSPTGLWPYAGQLCECGQRPWTVAELQPSDFTDASRPLVGEAMPPDQEKARSEC